MGIRERLYASELAPFFAEQGETFSFVVDYYFLAISTDQKQHPHLQHFPIYYELLTDQGQNTLSRNEVLEIIHIALRANKVTVPPLTQPPFEVLLTLPGTTIGFSVNKRFLVAVTTETPSTYRWIL